MNHTFIQITKLPNVRGRIYYITSPARQENLYATYKGAGNKFWQSLAEENQREFRKSGTKGRCIEARELIIMLPPSLIQYDHEALLTYLSAKFQEKYDTAVVSALHHNKKKTNLHIHLIFSERKPQKENVQRKVASRNMFYNEEGKHVRTKKEILDENGEIRKGCRIVKKGEVYETNFFEPKNPFFKSKAFEKEIKGFYTELINELVQDENEKLNVFDKTGPYLATKKIGKNNPKAELMEADNQVRKKWNQTVDHALASGMEEEQLKEIKKVTIVNEVARSKKEHGNRPERFAQIVYRAIQFLEKSLMRWLDGKEKKAESTEVIDAESKTVFMDTRIHKKRPSSSKQEAEFMKVQNIMKDINALSRQIYAISRKIEDKQKELDELSGGLLNYFKRKDLQSEIETLKNDKDKRTEKLSLIPKMKGYKNMSVFKKAYKEAERALSQVKADQKAWDESHREKKAEAPKKKSISQKLEEKKEIAKQQGANQPTKRDRKKDNLIQ